MSDVSAGPERHVTALGSSAASDLFQILRDGRPRTRTELSAITGLARSTIALRIDALMKLGLVGSVGDAVSTGGRPSSQFAIAASGRVVLGVDVGASHLRIAVSDLTGATLVRVQEQLDVAEGPEVVLDRVAEHAHALLAELGRTASDLLAIGIGLPGPVEHSSGRPINPPIMPGWDRFDVPGYLASSFAAPVLVDNDVNIMALGEREHAWPEVDHLIFVKVATGIGSGVISSGLLQRGAQGTAGDIGHVYVARGAEVPCACGNRGCLEALASGPAIARALTATGLTASSSQDVVELVKRGNIDAIQAVRQAGRDIGEVLTTCVSLINPSAIVIGGSLAQAGEHLIAGVREVVYTRSMPLATEHLQITQSKTGPDAAVLGASMLAIHHALAPESIEAMVAATAASR
ncbi:ROK family transcriptional regulator [Protaetiibacter sp. SSC-01]|uniref:ROK family transcriptional regulator n=1 Tax=Protaetiibacter sp. SSC-01 TaxID=2759943 RepID=UPI0016569BE0|nr:ROK family transcriptional regulator [Protaetiibacter sp. SSC-01]QNO37143.1 ROK family transcriptional regulator [Protaetiibacter sp. SSC-01]